MTTDEMAAIEERAKRAHAKVVDMCSGGRRWHMTVPVDFDRDHDVVIIAALADIDTLLEAVRSLQTEMVDA